MNNAFKSGRAYRLRGTKQRAQTIAWCATLTQADRLLRRYAARGWTALTITLYT